MAHGRDDYERVWMKKYEALHADFLELQEERDGLNNRMLRAQKAYDNQDYRAVGAAIMPALKTMGGNI